MNIYQGQNNDPDPLMMAPMECWRQRSLFAFPGALAYFLSRCPGTRDDAQSFIQF